MLHFIQWSTANPWTFAMLAGAAVGIIMFFGNHLKEIK